MKLDDLIRTMEQFLPVVESPLGSNKTPIGIEFGWNGVAWCAETISVACKRLGFPLHEAAVIRIEQHAIRGDYGMGWSHTPVLASAVCFDWKGNGNPADMHVGLVTEIIDPIRFRTIEGNYRDRCARVLRDMKFVRGFATFPFDGAASAPAASTPEPVPTQVPRDLTEKLMANAPVLKKNSQDRHHVGIMQAMLSWHAPDLVGDKNQFIDGDFGDNTERVLGLWQRRTGVLQGDGECGPLTWAWLCGV